MINGSTFDRVLFVIVSEKKTFYCWVLYRMFIEHQSNRMKNRLELLELLVNEKRLLRCCVLTDRFSFTNT